MACPSPAPPVLGWWVICFDFGRRLACRGVARAFKADRLLSRLILVTMPPLLYRFPQLNYEYLARPFAEISGWRTHVPRSLTKAEQCPVAHALEAGPERFQVQPVFAGKIVHREFSGCSV